MAKKFIYNGSEFFSDRDLRVAVWQNQRLAYGNPQTEEEFAALGIEVKIEIFSSSSLVSIENLREKKRKELSLRVNELLDKKGAKVEKDGRDFDANRHAFVDISACVTQAETDGENALIRDFSNNTVEMSLDDLRDLRLKIAQNISAIRRKKWKLETEINDAETVDDLRGLRFDF